MQISKLGMARILVISALLIVVLAVLVYWWGRFAVVYRYPSKLLDGRRHMALSADEESNGVIAKFELDQTQVGPVLAWYKDRGFTTVADSVQTNGYGQHGISFIISDKNQVLTLVVKEWKDLY